MDLRFFEIYRNPDYLWLRAEGAALSAGLTVTAGLAGLCLAIALATARFRNVPVLGPLAAAYVEFIRNTPLIVQLFFVAFGLPQLLGYGWPFWRRTLLFRPLNVGLGGERCGDSCPKVSPG